MEGERRLLSHWIQEYWEMYHIPLNINTLRKRRIISGLGVKRPPHSWMLTRDEFLEVIKTPLPFCNSVEDIR